MKKILSSSFVQNIKPLDKPVFISSLIDLVFLVFLFITYIITSFITNDIYNALLNGVENPVRSISTAYVILIVTYLFTILLWSLTRGIIYHFTYKYKFNYKKVLIHFGTSIGVVALITLLFTITKSMFTESLVPYMNLLILVIIAYCYAVFTTFIFSEKKVKITYRHSIEFKGILKVIASVFFSYLILSFILSVLNYILDVMNYTNNLTTDMIKSFILFGILLVGISWSRRYISDMIFNTHHIEIKKKD